MQPTDVLAAEHRLIEQVLNCLEKVVEKAVEDKKLEKRTAGAVIDFCRSFVDGCHHAKEEDHLFPAMEARGFAGGCSPVVVMRREHELGRVYIQGMDAAAEAAALGDPEALKWFIEHAQSYVRLLREHIHKEDTCLFPAANHALTEKDQQKLLVAFEKVETEEMRRGTHDKYVLLANYLADRLGVAKAAPGPSEHNSERGCRCER